MVEALFRNLNCKSGISSFGYISFVNFFFYQTNLFIASKTNSYSQTIEWRLKFNYNLSN